MTSCCCGSHRLRWVPWRTLAVAIAAIMVAYNALLVTGEPILSLHAPLPPPAASPPLPSPHHQMVKVVGKVYCLRCYNPTMHPLETRYKKLLKGAAVKVTCNSGHGEVVAYGHTDGHGRYRVAVDGTLYGSAKACKVELHGAPAGSACSMPTGLNVGAELEDYYTGHQVVVLKAKPLSFAPEKPYEECETQRHRQRTLSPSPPPVKSLEAPDYYKSSTPPPTSPPPLLPSEILPPTYYYKPPSALSSPAPNEYNSPPPPYLYQSLPPPSSPPPPSSSYYDAPPPPYYYKSSPPPSYYNSPPPPPSPSAPPPYYYKSPPPLYSYDSPSPSPSPSHQYHHKSPPLPTTSPSSSFPPPPSPSLLESPPPPLPLFSYTSPPPPFPSPPPPYYYKSPPPPLPSLQESPPPPLPLFYYTSPPPPYYKSPPPPAYLYKSPASTSSPYYPSIPNLNVSPPPLSSSKTQPSS